MLTVLNLYLDPRYSLDTVMHPGDMPLCDLHQRYKHLVMETYLSVQKPAS